MYARAAREPEDLDLCALLLAHLVVAIGLPQVGAPLVGAWTVCQRQPCDVHEESRRAIDLHLRSWRLRLKALMSAAAD